MNKLLRHFDLDKNSGKKLPLYKQIRLEIANMIQKGSMQTGDSLPSASYLANQLNVNYRTVRQAFNTLVKDGVLLYNPNRGYILDKPETIQSATRNSIMFIRPGSNAFCLSMSEGIHRYAKEENISLIEVDAKNCHQNSIEAIKNPGPNVGGLLVMPYILTDYVEALNYAISQGIHVVLIDRDMADVPVSSVMSDHFSGAYKATRHLLEQHSCPVYYFGFTRQPSSVLNWHCGWHEAMREYNYYDEERYTLPFPYTEADVYQIFPKDPNLIAKAAQAAFQLIPEKPFSILAGDDQMAREVYLAAEDFGLQVGRDIFIIGFGNSPLCEILPVKLTSVEQNSVKVGYEGAKLLHEQMVNYSSGVKRILIPTELHVRMSSTRMKMETSGYIQSTSA